MSSDLQRLLHEAHQKTGQEEATMTDDQAELFADTTSQMKVTLTEENIELYAKALAQIKLGDKGDLCFFVGKLLPQLGAGDLAAVTGRAEEIVSEISNSAHAMAEAYMWDAFRRLVAAANCPPGVDILPWLEERGLAQRSDVAESPRWWFKDPQPGSERMFALPSGPPPKGCGIRLSE